MFGTSKNVNQGNIIKEILSFNLKSEFHSKFDFNLSASQINHLFLKSLFNSICLCLKVCNNMC